MDKLFILLFLKTMFSEFSIFSQLSMVEENIVLFTTNCIFFESKQYFSSFKHQFLIFIQHKSFQKTAFNHHVLTLFNHHVLTEETRLPASWSRGGSCVWFDYSVNPVLPLKFWAVRKWECQVSTSEKFSGGWGGVGWWWPVWL